MSIDNEGRSDSTAQDAETESSCIASSGWPEKDGFANVGLSVPSSSKKSSSSAADLRQQSGFCCGQRRWRLALNIACVAGAVIVIAACFTIVAHHCSLPKLYIVLTVNSTGMADCPPPRANWSFVQLPCMMEDSRRTTVMMTSGRSLAPLACDQAGAMSCELLLDQFSLTPSRDGLIIREAGVYKVHSRVTFLESDPTVYATSTVRVDVGGSVGSDGPGGIWLDCASHSAHGATEDPYTDCTLDGVRRLQRGDIVSFHVRRPLLRVNLHHRATQFFVYKL